MATSKSGVSHSPAAISDDSATETDSEIHNFNHRDSPWHSDSTRFSVGDKVLASHKGVFYAAKVHTLSLFSEFIVLGLRIFKNEAKFGLICCFRFRFYKVVVVFSSILMSRNKMLMSKCCSIAHLSVCILWICKVIQIQNDAKESKFLVHYLVSINEILLHKVNPVFVSLCSSICWVYFILFLEIWASFIT